MQSKSLAFLFTILIAIPIIALSSNHEIFFAVMSLILAVMSVRHLFKLLSNESSQGIEADEDLEDELEELIDIDIKRLGTGLKITWNLLVILFMFYCAFYLHTILQKAIASFAIILQVYFIAKKTGRSTLPYDPDRYKPQFTLSSILNIAVILFTLINKIQKLQ